MRLLRLGTVRISWRSPWGALLLALCMGCGQAEPPPEFDAVAPSRDPYLAAMEKGENPPREQIVSLRIQNATIEVEVAGSGGGSNLGLMFRKEMGPDEGMWFEFDREEIRSFWMRNTRIPLSIAFIDSKGVITNIEDMTPFDPTHIWAEKPARYALEMNRGWFRKRGIRPGDAIHIGPKAPNPKLKKDPSSRP